MYTGQGSQYFGMCHKYYEENEVFRTWMNKLNEIALNETGKSVLRYLYEEKKVSARCDDILMTHLAIVMIEYSMTESLKAKGIYPDVLLGLSLGEYSCMAVSGMLPIKRLIRILVDHAYLLKRKCPEGKMVAVIADYNSKIELPPGVEIASIDYDKHFVISGNSDAVDNAVKILDKQGIDTLETPVRYGFHSSSIDSTKYDFMNMVSCTTPLVGNNIEIISSCKADKVHTYTEQDLWEIIRNPIRFSEAVSKHCNDEKYILVDVGPSGTLAGFSKNILKRSDGIYSIITPFNSETRNINKIIKEVL